MESRKPSTTRSGTQTDPVPRRYLAFATKGLEDVAAAELTELLRLSPGQARTGTKHVLFATDAEADTLLALTTVDDVCELVADPADVSTAHDLRDLLERADLAGASGHVAALRPLDGTFSVTVTAARSPVGSALDIATIAADTIGRRLRWQLRTDTRAPVDVRIFLDGTAALIGVRMSDGPLSDRAYRLVHRRGALRPTVAAAMIRLACADGRTHQIWDPFCGSGTLLAEAALAGHTVYGSDLDPDAIAATTANLAQLARTTPAGSAGLEVADATTEATWRRHSTVDTVMANLPWGKQIAISSAAALYAGVGLGVARVAARGGRACLLTTDPDRLAAAVRRVAPSLLVVRRKLGLLGQTPSLLTISAN